jgi:tetratricopeptide (TPR) repeat protein
MPWGHTRNGILGVMLVGALATQPLFCKDKNKAKELEQQAKAMIAQGKDLEKQGKLSEARRKYVDSQSIWGTGDAQKAIKEVDQTIGKRVAELTQDGAALYKKGKNQEALTKLQDASALRPNDPLVNFNLAAVYYKLDDRRKALVYLDQCQAALKGTRHEQEVSELRELVNTGETGNGLSDSAKQKAEAVDATMLSKAPDSPEHITNYATEEQKQEALRCKLLKESESTLPKTAAVLFNLAKCAENEGRFDAASQYFTRYLEAAPNSLDGGEVQLKVTDLRQLIALKDESGDAVRKHYAEAIRLLQLRKYNAALAEFKSAEQVAPNFAQTKFKIGLLYESMGNVQMAHSYLQQHLQLETSESARDATQALLDGLDAKQTKFKDSIAAAGESLTSAMKSEGSYAEASLHTHARKAAATALVPGAALMPRKSGGPPTQAQQRKAIELAQEKIEDSLALFPLSAEANALGAIAYLEGNNPEAARQCMDVLSGEGIPVAFYAKVRSYESLHKKKSKTRKVLTAGILVPEFEEQASQRKAVTRSAKVEISKTAVRVTYLDQPDPAKKKKPTPVPTKAASYGDGLANLSGPSTALVQADAASDVTEVPISSVQLIETKQELESRQKNAVGVRLKAGQKELFMVPEVATIDVPSQGPPARRFANNYTRLFSQYGGFDGVKLGPEHMSKGEKLELGMEMADIAMGGISNASAVAGTLRMLSIMTTTTRVMIALQQARNEQTLMLRGMDFKVIPTQPLQFAFRVEAFK